MYEPLSVVCYGDSNTWGTDPTTYERLPYAQRWTSVLARELGNSTIVLPEGLPNRSTDVDDPTLPHHNGLQMLPVLLGSHFPIDVLIIALGTNDLKARYQRSTQDAAAGAARLIACAQKYFVPEIILVAPSPIREIGWLGKEFAGGAAKSAEFAAAYRAVAEKSECAFLDSGSVWTVSDDDGVHFLPAEHEKLGAALARFISGRVVR